MSVLVKHISDDRQVKPTSISACEKLNEAPVARQSHEGHLEPQQLSIEWMEVMLLPVMFSDYKVSDLGVAACELAAGFIVTA